MRSNPSADLVVLVADDNMRCGVEGILSRQRALRIRPVGYTILVHPQKDPGCLQHGHDLLRIFAKSHAYALVMFDREGCGRERLSRDELERHVEGLLARCGWDQRAAAVVLDPEFEAWVWSDSPEVDAALGWAGRQPSLRDWLRAKRFVTEPGMKPARPKEAVEGALMVAGKPRSSSLYGQLARCVSVEHCADPAFAKLGGILRTWFAA